MGTYVYRGDAKLADSINEKQLIEKYNAWDRSDFFADYYNAIESNIFNITDKLILNKYDPENKYISKVKRKYTWTWYKEYDKGTIYDFPSELMTFGVNGRGEIIAWLKDLYLNREDANIPTIKYCYFFIKDTNIMLTVPNQADDGCSIAYINELGELIIDNDESHK